MFSNPSAGGFSSFSAASQPSSSSSLPFSFTNPTAPKNPTPLFNSFGTGGSFTGTSASVNDMVTDDVVDVDEDEADTVYLEPPAFSAKAKAKWKASGRAWLAAASPVGGEVVGWITNQPSSDPNKPATLVTDKDITVSDRTARFATINNFAVSEEKFYAGSYTLFTSLQQIVACSMRLPGTDAMSEMAGVWDSKGNLVSLDGLLGPPAADTVIQMRRLVEYYLDDLAKMREADDLDDEAKYRYESMYHIFNLAEILYLPADGRGEGLLGEELLDWGNQVDRIQINEQGNEIMAHKEPWDHMGFWPFIVRCLLRGFLLPAASFLRTLQTHPHPPIAKLGQIVERAVTKFPRSTNTAMYPLDHQFVSAHKRWLAEFRADKEEFVGGRNGHWFDPEGTTGRSKWFEWEDGFRSVIELLEGKTERLFAEAADWREVLGAWGVLVDVSLTRDDLPGVVRRILDEVPIDSTILEDSVQSSLCSGDIIEALMGSHDIDRWLAAHLGDVFDKLALVPDDEERFDTSLRDYYLLDYADMLQESPSQSELWRVIAEYLSSAGSEGRGRLRTYIVHVGTRVDEDKGKDKEDTATANGMDIEGGANTGANGQLAHFKELHEACIEFKLDEEWRMISTIVAERLVQKGDVGVAATICLLAEDGYMLSRIAEKILNSYVEVGESEFLRLVDSLPQTMMQEAPQKFNELKLAELDSGDGYAGGGGRTIMVMFASRLAFLSEFRDYLIHLGQGSRDVAAKKLAQLLSAEITPVEFWAVLLSESVDLLEDEDILINTSDTFDLMRVVEDVLANAKFAPVDYLRQLWRYLARTAAKSANGAAATANATAENGKKVDETKEGTAAALRRLEVVRLALARNLSRALVVGA